ncbi:hypothetical protein SNEBB_008567 [Seison nebaliae]|nr:hypothetical protein SNEBB_008567 [Seison nebaliae]
MFRSNKLQSYFVLVSFYLTKSIHIRNKYDENKKSCEEFGIEDRFKDYCDNLQNQTIILSYNKDTIFQIRNASTLISNGTMNEIGCSTCENCNLNLSSLNFLLYVKCKSWRTEKKCITWRDSIYTTNSIRTKIFYNPKNLIYYNKFPVLIYPFIQCSTKILQQQQQQQPPVLQQQQPPPVLLQQQQQPPPVLQQQQQQQPPVLQQQQPQPVLQQHHQQQQQPVLQQQQQL